MLCSARELRLATDGEGLLILSPAAPAGMALAELFPVDWILDLEVTPNRSDLLSHLGLAREVGALTGLAVRNPLDAMETPPGEVPGTLPVVIAANARAGCPFYTACVIDGITVGPSPDWLRERLEAVGLRPINNVVDVTNYVMLELGQPLHAFDAARVGLSGIGVRLASPGEELKALDGRTYKLAAHHLVNAQISVEKIDGSEQAQGLAGLMGGEDSGVTAATRSIILEAAYFTPTWVRRTARELGLNSDASYRFERGVDPEGIVPASRRAQDLILRLCGGESRGLSESHPLAGHDGLGGAKDIEVMLRPERCRAMLGVALSDERIAEILAGFGLQNVANTRAEPAYPERETWWRIPSYRLDLRREIDLIEEVARVHGLDDVPASQEAWLSPSSASDHEYDFQLALKRQMAGLGFVEARHGSLVRHDPAAGGVPLRNPLSEENAVLRGTMLPGLLATAGRNARQGAGALRLFEIGRLFTPELPAGQPEPVRLALLITGPVHPATWRRGDPARPLDLYDLRAVLDRLAAPRRVQLRPLDPRPETGANMALAAEILIDGQPAGSAGQLSPAFARELELRGEVLMAEIPLAALATAAASERKFAPVPRFPSVTRDLAVVIERRVGHEELSAVLDHAREPLLVDVALFDVFTDDQGEKIAADRKSLAYSLTYRAPIGRSRQRRSTPRTCA